MGENTKLEWRDHEFNPWRERGDRRVVAAESAWRRVEKWHRDWLRQCETYAAEVAEWDSWNGKEPPLLPHPPAVFCGSLCDVFEYWTLEVRDSRGSVVNARTWKPIESEGPEPATIADIRQRIFRLIDATPNLNWLLLTKRPQNIRPMWCSHVNTDGKPPSQLRRDNVWLGTSIACQEDADRNIPELLKCRDLCAGIFLSIEPLIGPVDLSTWLGTKRVFSRDDMGRMRESQACIDQVIIGGESGPNARLCDVDWIRSIARQCEAAGVLCFVKQLGSKAVDYEAMKCVPGHDRKVVGKATAEDLSVLKRMIDVARLALRDKKGGDPDEWPDDLRVRNLAWKGGA